MIYRSNLSCPDLSPHFKLLSKPRAYSLGHDVPSDPDYEPECGYWTHDEAAILYNVARRFGGGEWADLGCRFGWTSAHLAAAGCAVCCVDTVLQFASGQARFEANMGHAWDYVSEVRSEKVQDWAGANAGSEFDGFVIDADHDAPQPFLDAQACVNLAADECVIMLHDFMGRPIQEAVEWLLDIGFHCRIYNTPNMVACCWRGDFLPPDHVPDPTIDWAFIRRQQLSEFDFSRTE